MYLIIIMMYLDGFNICDPQSFRENLVRLSLYCSPTCSTYQQWLTFPAPSSPLQSGTQHIHILVFRDFFYWLLSRALFVWLRLWSWFQIRPRPGSGSWCKVAFRMFFEDLKTTTTTVGNFVQPRLVKYYMEKEKELNKELCLRFAKYFKVFFTFVGWCQSESHLQISLPALLQNVQLIGYLYKTKL